MNELSSLGLLILDEVSMASATDLDRINRAMNGVKRVSAQDAENVLMGGCHYIFTGDLYQLSPVQGTSFVKDMKDRQNTKAHTAGLEIWEKNNVVVILDEQMRQKNDIEYAQLLRRARTNRLTREDCQKLNGRVVKDMMELEPGVLLLCASNAEREAWNRRVFRNYMKAATQKREDINRGEKLEPSE